MARTVAELMAVIGLDDKPLIAGMKAAGKKVEQEAEKTGSAAGDGLTGEMGKSTEKGGGRISGALTKLGPVLLSSVAAIAAAGGALLVAGFVSALEREDLAARLASRIDAAPDEAARLGRIAGKVYADNFGASMDEVADAMAGVIQNIDGVGQASDRVIERATKKTLTFASVWDQDVAKATGAVGQMVRTGLARDFDHAFDILATGMSNGANKADDLLDTFNEYSVQFQRMGLTGEQALGMISQAVKAGARDADVAADALKEWAIKVREPMRESAGDIEGAARRVRDAQKSITEAHRGVASAEQSVADARVSAFERVVAAAKTTEQAERSLADAQAMVRQKQLDLTQARKDAAAELQGLTESLTDAELSGRSSALSLERAQENLQKVMADPEATELQRKEAKLTVDQALRGVATQEKRIGELRQKKAEADAAGVEGSKQVADANQAIADAQAQVGTAEERLTESRVAQVQSVVDGNKSVAQAMDSVRSAVEGVQRAEESLADARKASAAAAARPLTTLGQAYADIGLDGEKIQAMLNEGPDGQAKALQLVQDGLRGVADESKRSELAALISGTMAEDMGAAFFAMDLASSTAADGLDNVAGATERAAARLDTNKSKWESFRKQGMEKLTNFMGEKVLPMIERFAGNETVQKWAEKGREAFDRFGDGLGRVGTWIQETLWPALQSVGSYLADTFGPVVESFANLWATILGPALGFVWDMIENYLWPAWKKIADVIWNTVIPAVAGIIAKFFDAATWIATKIGEIVGWVVGLPGRIRETISNLWEGLKERTTNAKDWIVEKLDAVVSFFKEMPGKIRDSASGMWDGFKDAFKSAFNWIVDKWNGLEFTMPEMNLGPLGKVGGWTVGVPDIPRFHTGGVVPGPKGSEMLAILEGGERVLTAGQQRMLGLESSVSRLGSRADSDLGAVGRSYGGPASVTPISQAPSARGATTINNNIEVSTDADPWKIASAAAFATAHSGVA